MTINKTKITLFTYYQVTAFHPSESTQAATVVDNKVLIWDMGEGEARLNTDILLEGKGQ